MVGGIPTPLKHMSSSVGMMIIPNIKNKIHVPNHQYSVGIYKPDIFLAMTSK